MYALITRAIRNVGDDLIHQRGRRLIEHVAPGTELVQAKGWLPLEESLSSAEIARLEGIIVPGGPGVRRNLARIYPFLEGAAARGIPVAFLGVGSRFFPATLRASRELLDPATVETLRRAGAHAPIGVRDHLTRRALLDARIDSQVNGCPAWYSIDHIDTRPALPKAVSRVALTPPAELLFFPQCIALMRATRALLPSARVLVGFHHGVRTDDPVVTTANLELVGECRALGFEVEDLAADSEKLKVYADCDLHIGYRVHAHIFFSSLRKPTFLVAEDSRGLGVLQTLAGVGIVGWNELAEHEPTRRLAMRARPSVLALPGARVAEWLELALEVEMDLGFARVEASSRIIDQAFHTRMKPFIERVVGRSPSRS
jgi:hypothetical protein